MVNYINEKELSMAYILDGVNPKMAKIKAKLDAFNNPALKEQKRIEKETLNDLTKILGGKLTIIDKLKIMKANKPIKKATRLSGIFDLVGVGVLSAILVIIVVCLGLVIRTAIFAAAVYVLYNLLLASAFDIALLTTKQILIIAFICALVIPMKSEK